MEEKQKRTKRIISLLKEKYPNKNCFDLTGKGNHFVCELEPTSEHPEYDKAIEVIISSAPHKHRKMIQHYKIISGILNLHLKGKEIILREGEEYTINPETIHWAESSNECWVEILSRPGWTQEDHIEI